MLDHDCKNNRKNDNAVEAWFLEFYYVYTYKQIQKGIMATTTLVKICGNERDRSRLEVAYRLIK